jgi:Macrocin-O-methyltransferase (TylF)
MHLFDSFEGIDPKRALPDEASDHIEMANAFYRRPGLFQLLLDRFAPCPEVSVYKGYLPEALEGRTPDAIASLHIDLNAARPEVETLERLFDRVVPSGVIVLDDYGWLVHKEQKHAEDAFFAERFYSVFELPTGQGVVVKRPAEIGRGSA